MSMRLLLFGLLLSVASAVENDAERIKSGELPTKAEIEEAEKLAAGMPASVKGHVFLDRNGNNRLDEGEGLSGVRVTDGVDFAMSDEKGGYTLEIRPDPLVPHMPSRTVSVCWPTGTWPARLASGKFAWWVRMMDIGNPNQVDFRLLPREEREPVVVSFGTDPHDNFTRPHNFHWLDETAMAGDHVTFAVSGGDLGYMNFGNANAAYATIRKFTHEFPVLMTHCIGNHDVVGVHATTWSFPHELAGYGAFHKHVGPSRWSFDVAGIHFVGMDWLLIDGEGKTQCGLADSALDWLERDLASLPQKTPVYFFNHQPWAPTPRFHQILARHGVKLAMGGHSHRNMFLNEGPLKPGDTEFWTKMSLYTLVYARKDGFDVVDRCVYKGNRTGWNNSWGHETRGCALVNDFGGITNADLPEADVQLHNVTLESGATRRVDLVPGPTYDIRIGARGSGDKPVGSWGLRLTGSNHETLEFSYHERRHMLSLMGLETCFHPIIPTRDDSLATLKPLRATTSDDSDHWIEMRIMVTPDRVRVLVGNRLHYEKFVKPGAASLIEVFATDGSAEFPRIDVWQRDYPVDYRPRRTANTG